MNPLGQLPTCNTHKLNKKSQASDEQEDSTVISGVQRDSWLPQAHAQPQKTDISQPLEDSSIATLRCLTGQVARTCCRMERERCLGGRPGRFGERRSCPISEFQESTRVPERCGEIGAAAAAIWNALGCLHLGKGPGAVPWVLSEQCSDSRSRREGQCGFLEDLPKRRPLALCSVDQALPK